MEIYQWNSHVWFSIFIFFYWHLVVTCQLRHSTREKFVYKMSSGEEFEVGIVFYYSNCFWILINKCMFPFTHCNVKETLYMMLAILCGALKRLFCPNRLRVFLVKLPRKSWLRKCMHFDMRLHTINAYKAFNSVFMTAIFILLDGLDPLDYSW